MKKRDLEKKLSDLGWYFLRAGSDHDIWTNGKDIEPVGRHREIPEGTARKILRTATRNPGGAKEK
jgi:mRNA interferase HicA